MPDCLVQYCFRRFLWIAKAIPPYKGDSQSHDELEIILDHRLNIGSDATHKATPDVKLCRLDLGISLVFNRGSSRHF
jgi:hypothetical protein